MNSIFCLDERHSEQLEPIDTAQSGIQVFSNRTIDASHREDALFAPAEDREANLETHSIALSPVERKRAQSAR